jgi:hypothetical protein
MSDNNTLFVQADSILFLLKVNGFDLVGMGLGGNVVGWKEVVGAGDAVVFREGTIVGRVEIRREIVRKLVLDLTHAGRIVGGLWWWSLLDADSRL